MSWNSKMTATEKAQLLFTNMLVDYVMEQLRFPLPRGAYSVRERPEWYR